jgi:hypothetical protein
MHVTMQLSLFLSRGRLATLIIFLHPGMTCDKYHDWPSSRSELDNYSNCEECAWIDAPRSLVDIKPHITAAHSRNCLAQAQLVVPGCPPTQFNILSIYFSSTSVQFTLPQHVPSLLCTCILSSYIGSSLLTRSLSWLLLSAHLDANRHFCTSHHIACPVWPACSTWTSPAFDLSRLFRYN